MRFRAAMVASKAMQRRLVINWRNAHEANHAKTMDIAASGDEGIGLSGAQQSRLFMVLPGVGPE